MNPVLQSNEGKTHPTEQQDQQPMKETFDNVNESSDKSSDGGNDNKESKFLVRVNSYLFMVTFFLLMLGINYKVLQSRPIQSECIEVLHQTVRSSSDTGHLRLGSLTPPLRPPKAAVADYELDFAKEEQRWLTSELERFLEYNKDVTNAKDLDALWTRHLFLQAKRDMEILDTIAAYSL